MSCDEPMPEPFTQGSDGFGVIAAPADVHFAPRGEVFGFREQAQRVGIATRAVITTAEVEAAQVSEPG